MPTKKLDPTALAIEELEWSLEGNEGNINRCWETVERAQRWVSEYQQQLTLALEKYTEAVARRDGVRYALTVLRNHEENHG